MAAATAVESFDVEIADNGLEEVAKLLTNAKFARITHSDKPEDSVEGVWMMTKFMMALYGDGYIKVEDHYDGEILDMWEFTAGKLKKLGDAAQAE